MEAQSKNKLYVALSRKLEFAERPPQGGLFIRPLLAHSGPGTEAMLEVALVIFLAKLIDPIAALPALVAGYFCRTWWQVVISAAAVGLIVEMVLVLLQRTPEIHQGRLLMGVLAAGVWSNLAFAFKIWRVKRARKIGES